MNNVPPLPSPGEASSLGGRLLNIFTAPGQVFDELKTAPVSHANWLVPVVLACLLGVFSVLVLFSQPAILQQVREQQSRAIELKMGHLPAEQRAQTQEMVEKITSPVFLKIVGSLGAVAGTCGYVLATALALWLVAQMRYKTQYPFLKFIEAVGLAWMIMVLGSVLTTLLAVGKGSLLASPGPVLFLANVDPTNFFHRLLAACNLIHFWLAAVLTLALARLAGQSYWRVLPWLLAPLLVIKLVTALAGMGGL